MKKIVFFLVILGTFLIYGNLEVCLELNKYNLIKKCIFIKLIKKRNILYTSIIFSIIKEFYIICTIINFLVIMSISIDIIKYGINDINLLI